MKSKVYRKLRKNNVLGKKPTTVTELATLLKTSRTAIYDAFNGNAKNVEKKIDDWLNSNDDSEIVIAKKSLLLVKKDRIGELKKFGFKYSFGLWEKNIIDGETCRFQMIVNEDDLILNMYVDNDYKTENLEYNDLVVAPDDEFEEPRINFSMLIVDEFLPIDGVVYDLIVDGIVYKG